MKENFPGYFHLNDDEKKELLASAVITLDANVLLNLYRYSDETRAQFLSVLQSLSSRLWLSHQATKEFLENRLSVIAEKNTAYRRLQKELEAIESTLHNTNQQPFVSLQLQKMFSEIKELMNYEFQKFQKENEERYTNDEILSELAIIFDGKVGKPFSESQIKQIIEEGKRRYSVDFPPGYKDSSKNKGDKTGLRQYGDLFMWKQIIEYSKNSSEDILFITNDSKEDWWLVSSDRTLQPRPELIDEFLSETGQKFHMYKPYRFMQLFGEKNDTLLNEIKISGKEAEVFIEKKYSLIDSIQKAELQVDRLDNTIEELESFLFSANNLAKDKEAELMKKLYSARETRDNIKLGIKDIKEEEMINFVLKNNFSITKG